MQPWGRVKKLLTLKSAFNHYAKLSNRQRKNIYYKLRTSMTIWLLFVCQLKASCAAHWFVVQCTVIVLWKGLVHLFQALLLLRSHIWMTWYLLHVEYQSNTTIKWGTVETYCMLLFLFFWSGSEVAVPCLRCYALDLSHTFGCCSR